MEAAAGFSKKSNGLSHREEPLDGLLKPSFLRRKSPSPKIEGSFPRVCFIEEDRIEEDGFIIRDLPEIYLKQT